MSRMVSVQLSDGSLRAGMAYGAVDLQDAIDLVEGAGA
jgi:hypothetical protein